MKNCLLLLLLCLPKPTAQAQAVPDNKAGSDRKVRPLVTDRPGISESPFLIGQGDFQLETGLNLELDNSPASQRQTFTYLSTLAKVGISDNCELRLLADYVRNQNYDRLNDRQTTSIGWMPLLVGTKIVVMKAGRSQPQVSFIGYLKLPIVTSVYNTHYIAPLMKVAVQHPLNQRWSLGYNLGASWDGERPAANGLYTLSLSRSLRQKAGMFVEIYGFFGSGLAPDHRADAGFTYLLADKLQVDLSGGLGFSKNSPDGFLNMGVAWRIFRP